MNNKVIYSFVAVLVAASISGCEKQVKESTVEDRLVGTWQWIRTDGGFAFHIHETPATTGKNIDLIITSDGKYSIYTNGALTSNGTYVLETRKCIHDHTNKTFINFSTASDFMVERIETDILESSDEAYDGVGSIYKRKN